MIITRDRKEDNDDDDDDATKVPAVIRRTLQENKFPLLHLLLLWKNLQQAYHSLDRECFGQFQRKSSALEEN